MKKIIFLIFAAVMMLVAGGCAVSDRNINNTQPKTDNPCGEWINETASESDYYHYSW